MREQSYGIISPIQLNQQKILKFLKNLSKVGKARHTNAIIANNYQILSPDTNAKQISTNKLEFLKSQF